MTTKTRDHVGCPVCRGPVKKQESHVDWMDVYICPFEDCPVFNFTIRWSSSPISDLKVADKALQS